MTPDELEGARAALQSDSARAGEGPQGRARRLGFAAAIARDADDGKNYQEAIDSLGPAELQHAASELLTVRQLTVAVALPDGAPAGGNETAAALTPRLEAIVAAAPGLAEKHAAPAGPAVGTGDAIRFVTPGGVRVLVVSDGSAPLVSVQAAWVDRADGLEPPADDAAPAIAALLDAGTRTRSRAAVADEARAIRRCDQGIRGRGHARAARATSCRSTSRGAWRWSRTAWRVRPSPSARSTRSSVGCRRACATTRAAPPKESGRRCGCSARRSGRTPRAAPRRTRRPRWAASRCSTATAAATRCRV